MNGTAKEGDQVRRDPFLIPSRNRTMRLLVIPLLVYVAWLIEIFLFEGTGQLFLTPGTPGILLYTIVGCILVGIVVPVFLMKRAFLSGEVNMLQFGFRSMNRTVAAAALTGVVLYGAIILSNPFGADKTAFATAFLLLLPTGIATVMCCWVLAGTHLQALVRGGGAVMSIPVGVVMTSILFALACLAMLPGTGSPESTVAYICAGGIAGVFFFAVRDVWATALGVTGCLVYLLAGRLDAVLLEGALPVLAISSVLAAGTLAGIHRYLSRHYVTVPAPAA
jgi:hypothetical protein